MSKFSRNFLNRSSANAHTTTPTIQSVTEELDKVATLFRDIRTSGAEYKERISSIVQQFLVQNSRDSSPEAFQKVVNNITSEIFSLTNSDTLSEQMYGIYVMDGLIEFELEHSSNALKITRLSNYLIQILEVDDIELMTKTAEVLGKLVRFEGSVSAEIVDSEIRECFSWLKSNIEEYKKQAAALVLKALAINAPSQFYVYVSDFLNLIWSALTASKLETRLCAADSLHAAFELTATRKGRSRFAWFDSVWQNSLVILNKQPSAEQMHGALLAIQELIASAKEVMIHRVKEVLENVLKLKDFSVKGDKGIIKKTVVLLMPRIAAFSPEMFYRHYFKSCTEFLIDILTSNKEDQDKPSAFLAIGDIIAGVPSGSLDKLEQFIPRILSCIKTNLTNRKQFCFESITCLSKLSTVTDQQLISLSEWDELLPTIFLAGLNERVTEAASILGKNVPSKMPDIQIMLLQLLTYIITKKPYSIQRTCITETRDKSIKKPIPPNQKLLSAWCTIQMDDELVKLALQTLGSFGFEKELVLEFVREVIVGFLDNDDIAIRRSAVITCANIIRPTEKKLSSIASSIIRQVFEKLLIVGIADTDPLVRTTVLESFDETFDVYLAMAENLRSLFIALNDEVFDVRKLAIRMIGRLTLRNPAYVMPSMRKTLVQLLTELEFSGDSIKEESATLLGHLINSSKQLIKPYCKPILAALLDKLNDNNARVASAVLQTLGELSMVAGSEVDQHLNVLLPIVISSLKDKSSTRKRQIALKSLGYFIESTGQAILPLKKYPELLDILLSMIKTERLDSMREELIRVIGILGALDPFQYKIIQRNALNLKKRDDKESPEDVLNTLSPSSQEYGYAASIIALMKILADNSLSVYHTTVIDTALSILSNQQGEQISLLIPFIMPPFLKRLRESDSTKGKEIILLKLGDIVSIAGDYLVDYLGEIFDVIVEFWNRESNIIELLSLIESLGDIFTVHLPDLVPQILSLLQKDFTDINNNSNLLDEWEPVLKVLHTLEVIAHNLEDYLHLVIPALVRLMEQDNVPYNVRKETILTIGRLSFELNFEDYASRIGHPLSRILETEPNLQDDVMDTLSILVYQLWSNYAIVVQVINKVMIKKKISHQLYENLVTPLLKKLPRPELPNEFKERMKPRKNIRKLRSNSQQFILPSSVNISSTSTTGNNNTSGNNSGGGNGTGTGNNSNNSSNMNNSGNNSNITNSGSNNSLKEEFHVNEHGLQKAWTTSNRSTKEDWNEWMRKFSVELLKNSSCFALRQCFDLAQRYNSLAMQLFNPAFLSVWTILSDLMQDQLVQVIITALSSKESPPEIMQILLNCLEWMERDGKPISSIDIKQLGEFGTQCHAYAKALHYKEIEFRQKPDSKTIEELISLNNQLQQPEAAVGILTFAQKQHDVKFYPSWYIKLQRWDDALNVYEGGENNNNDESILQRITCYNALGEWDKLLELVNSSWEKEHIRSDIAHYGASAAWHLNNWEYMEQLVNRMDEGFESSFYQCILSIKNEKYIDAQKYINLARRQMDNELTALVGESYHRAYDEFVRVQQLSEMEEIIQFKQSLSSSSSKDQDILRKKTIIQLWENRLNGCQRNVDVWERILSVRSLVLSPKDDPSMWLQYANLCRSSNAIQESRKAIITLLGKDYFKGKSSRRLPNHSSPLIIESYLSQLWVEGDKKQAFDQMIGFINSFDNSIDNSFKASCYLKLGQWKRALVDILDEKEIHQILDSFKTARDLSPNWYKAWNEWAYINYEILSLYEKEKKYNELTNHLISSIDGFFHCISLSPYQSLQDTLRILTLWFKYGDRPQAIQTIRNGFDLVSIDTWLQVIPQIIARIHSPALHISKLIKELLIKVGRAHPQALVFPLTVASQSKSDNNNSDLNNNNNSDNNILLSSNEDELSSDASYIILNDLKKHSNELVKETSMVSKELIRVSIVWHEMWHEALEEASRYYFNQNNPDSMLETLFAMHKEVERGPETLREVSFEQLFGRDLKLAFDWCKRYQKTRKLADINQAWEIYSTIFRRIVKMMGQMKTFDLEYVSPYLLNAQDLKLAVPGTYKANSEIIRIKSFNRELKVFSSKQRPRQMSMEGNDGITYTFLLKGHEDLRQDERVMQLFGLVNTLLSNDPETSKSHLNITRFSVIPLSPNSGVIGWVPSCDTLLKLVQDYRESKGIELRTEHNRLFQMLLRPDKYEHLTIIQKVEAFEYSQAGTSGEDLNAVLWLKSKSAESWLERRLTYTRSLALMSMVGYILGLGDRHPSNLMLERINGKIVHIDFGDCFEVAMTRDKFPEKVPFRLTRMLVYAMEASQIEGNFRATCENVMRVMRTNKESLMAVLEAFVHDPLLNWRLLGTENEPSDEVTKSNTEGGEEEEQDLRKATPLSRKQQQLSGTKLTAESAQETVVPEVLNEKAVEVITRVQQKLTGTDFTNSKLTVEEQVAKLIDQATSHENLAQGYFGWCPFW